MKNPKCDLALSKAGLSLGRFFFLLSQSQLFGFVLNPRFVNMVKHILLPVLKKKNPFYHVGGLSDFPFNFPFNFSFVEESNKFLSILYCNFPQTLVFS